MGRRAHFWLTTFAVLAAGVVAGCAQTTRVGDDVSTAKLAQTQKAVAVMRLGAASPACNHVAVLLGSRLGEGYKREQVVIVANVRSVLESPIAEVEMAPGEYHVIGYSCQQQKAQKTVTDKAGASIETGQMYRTSYASFTVGAGEIVNVGYFHFGASHAGRSAFGRPLRIETSVSDWPLDELKRFQKERPAIYAQMVTRLMKITAKSGEVSVDDCGTYKALQAEGKIQQIPAVCAPLEAAAVAPAKVSRKR
jgi:hypothetical protein